MRTLSQIFSRNKQSAKQSLANLWDVNRITDTGEIFSPHGRSLMFELEGMDGSFCSADQMNSMHQNWRSALRLLPGEELQIIFRKRVEFADWVDAQIAQSFLGDNAYGRRILLDRLAAQMAQMGAETPRLLSQRIFTIFHTTELLSEEDFKQKSAQIRSQLAAFGFGVRGLNRPEIEQAIKVSAHDTSVSEASEGEWPPLTIEAGHVQIGRDEFRAVELTKLPENFTELGMIQAVTSLPLPMDLTVRIQAKDGRPIIGRLERKRNLLNAKRGSKNVPSAQLSSQIEQIDEVLKSLADQAEGVFELQMCVGLRMPPALAAFHRKGLADIIRAGTKMNFCEFKECTLETFDAYLEGIPGFRGKNLTKHTVLGSNVAHFLPFFRPAKGDRRSVLTFQTRSSTVYGIDPVDGRLANYNWLVSGTSGAGKSFFVNSILAQSVSIDPNVFIVDIGGSYNKLTQFLGGRVMSLEPGQGFELSPFFLPKSGNVVEERIRRQHIFKVFLEMTRIDGKLPSVEIRHLLSESLAALFKLDTIPEHPVTHLIHQLADVASAEARHLVLLLKPWSREFGFFGQYIDNNKAIIGDDRILTFDLKGLTEFSDLSRVVQLIVCASLWAKIRQNGNQRFSWIVLDEVAFSLLKTQPEFVDELVSTLRKYYAGTIIVVQDLEKVTSNFAGSSILQNTQTKAILQQRGDPRNFSAALALNQVDQWAIESLRRENGAYSEVFLIRDDDKTIIRHVPSKLEYWLGTTAPDDTRKLREAARDENEPYQKQLIDFVERRKSV